METDISKNTGVLDRPDGGASIYQQIDMLRDHIDRAQPPEKPLPVMASHRGRLFSAASQLWLLFVYLLRDARKNKRPLLMGCTAIALVVAILSAAQDFVSKAPLIFLKLSEDIIGEYDLLCVGQSTSAQPIPLLNFTSLNAALDGTTSLEGASPRWLFPSRIRNSQNASDWKHAYLLVVDFELEKRIGLASSWPYQELSQGQISITASLLPQIHVEPNSNQNATVQLALADYLQLSLPSLGVAGQGGPSQSFDVLSAVLPPGSNYTLSPLFVSLLNPTLANTISESFSKDSSGNYIVDQNGVTNFVNNSPQYQFNNSFVVMDGLESPFGKYPSSIGNVILMDYQTAQAWGQNILVQAQNDSVLGLVLSLSQSPNGTSGFDPSTFRLKDYTMLVSMMMADRVQSYLEDATARVGDLISFSNDVFLRLGTDYPMRCYDLLSNSLDVTDLFRVYFQQALLVVVIVLVFLGCLVIYSVLLTNVSEKTYEFGMLRMLGMSHGHIVNLLISQYLFLAIPGVSVGLLVGFLISLGSNGYIFSLTRIVLAPGLGAVPIALGASMGFAFPLIGITVPIQRALGKTLRDSLDMFHHMALQTSATVQTMESLGVSPTHSLLALVVVGVGLLVYCGSPLAFVLGDTSLFFTIMTTLLIGLIIGLVVIGHALQHPLEHVLAFCIIWGADRPLHSVVSKNLTVHRSTNSTASLIFSLCLAFIIFAAAMFDLQSSSFSEQIEWSQGSNVVVSSSSIGTPLNASALREYFTLLQSGSLEDRDPSVVESFSFASFPMNQEAVLSSSQLRSLVSISAFTVSVQITALESSFLSSVNSRYYVPSATDESLSFPMTSSGKPDIFQTLYNPSARAMLQAPLDPPLLSDYVATVDTQFMSHFQTTPLIPVIIADSLKNDIITVNQHLILDLSVNSAQASDKIFIVKPIAAVEKLPGFPSIIQQSTSNTPLFVTFSDYAFLLNVSYGASSLAPPSSGISVPVQRAFVNIRDSASADQKLAVVNDLNTLVTGSTFTVTTLDQEVSVTAATSSSILVIFYIVSFVAVILCFIVLWVTFLENMRSSSWELGVLRSIGLEKLQIVKIYVYEAVSLLLASMLVGTVVGLLTSATLNLQFTTFLDLPFDFSFPLGLFIFTVLVSLSVGVLASAIPANAYNRIHVAQLLKGGL
ncbi:uncharacterized protein BJ171DRAFT_609452 [Polychytrium aggregatum]|uniref:uncharacterized protein n=1 Tax=Polychytrium aggregatum TaxID=110093 RepID=UPI0022FE5063|nr:uncharacterized protein BJ171DRAFT_609452 [Polychytrium aggregatum]KAI9209917.1 hypothetical protein BJ171DRAFT_609452 [Polychytrium aggregatum]